MVSRTPEALIYMIRFLYTRLMLLLVVAGDVLTASRSEYDRYAYSNLLIAAFAPPFIQSQGCCRPRLLSDNPTFVLLLDW